MQNLSINIVMLGGSGAGKTVYLSSIYKKLASQGTEPHNKFFLEIDNYSDQIELVNISTSLISSDNSWPPGTRSIKDWKFNCCIRNTNGDKYNVCSFNYIDYAGGTLTNIYNDPLGEQKQIEFIEKVREASVLLGVLDGKKIVDLMQNSGEVATFINRDLFIIPKIMSDVNCPYHFVVSKWDYVETHNYSLENVRDKLLEIKILKDLSVQSKNRIRIIPVSSVGKGFATFQKMPDGKVKMLKTGRNYIEPFQVEVPLAYALIDVVQNASKQLENKIERMNAFSRFFFALRSIFINPLPEFMPPGTQFIARKILENINKITSNNFEMIIFKTHKDIKNEKEAFNQLISCFEYIIQGFEDAGRTSFRKIN